MRSALDIIMTRRSVRRFTDKPIEEKIIEDILRAAMAAPSAGNQQPWHFTIIKNREILKKIPDVHPYAQMVPQAQLAILVCGDESQERHKGYWVQDCAAATQNLLLAAHAFGLGAVWLGVYPREDRAGGLRALCKVAERLTPFSLVPLGYPGEEKGPADRFNKEKIELLL